MYWYKLTPDTYSYTRYISLGVSNESYNEHETTNDELYNINKSLCIRKESIICVGGLNSVTNIFTLVSCGSCWQVLMTTSLNQPRLVNGAW